MFVIIGYIIVISCVLGGFVLSGGHLAALFQPYELLIIGGAALGSFIVSNDWRNIKNTGKAVGSVFKGCKYKKEFNVQLLSLFFELLNKIRKEGMLAVENDIQKLSGKPDILQIPTGEERQKDHGIHY